MLCGGIKIHVLKVRPVSAAVCREAGERSQNDCMSEFANLLRMSMTIVLLRSSGCMAPVLNTYSARNWINEASAGGDNDVHSARSMVMASLGRRT